MCEWLARTCRLDEESLGRFREEGVNGEDLLGFNESMLDDLGVTKALHRKRFLRELAKLKPSPDRPSRVAATPRVGMGGRYEIQTHPPLLGRGASGITFKVKDMRENDFKALKIVECENLDAANQTLKEAMTMTQFKHPSECTLRHAFTCPQPRSPAASALSLSVVSHITHNNPPLGDSCAPHNHQILSGVSMFSWIRRRGTGKLSTKSTW